MCRIIFHSASGSFSTGGGFCTLTIFATALVCILAGTISITAAFSSSRGSLSFVFATGVQLIVHLIGSFYLFGIVTGSRHTLLDLGSVGRSSIILYRKFFSVHIPKGISSAGTLGSLFNLALAHTALTGNLDLFSFILGKAS